MGQKVHPYIFRVGISKGWKSTWYADKNYHNLLHEDLKLRKYLMKKLGDAGIAEIEIQRSADQITVLIHTSKPGIIIGRSGSNIDVLREDVRRQVGANVEVKVIEIRKPDLNAQLIADNVALQLERRIPFRRACKQAIERAREAGVKGIKISLSGRLNGAEIARNEVFKEGNVPLHTLRADIDYALGKARTTYGAIGVKVWLYHGLIFKNQVSNTTDK
ncbi:MAG: 30S ribosomal protein S3 [Candidatus Gracilibacteria bacterium]|nr:30S ribosomal protein S3 [Candidatus Gracilibacteria bacterium]